MPHCQMVKTAISASLCDSEQGSQLCQGCKAETRRCTRCGKAGGITDANEGHCASCAEPGALKAGPGASIRYAMSEKLYQLQDIQSRSVRSERKEKTAHGNTKYIKHAEIQMSKLASDTEATSQVLHEHAEAVGEEWHVKELARILALRLRLIPEECEFALKLLVEKKMLESSAPWNKGKLLSKRPEFSAKDQPQQMGNRRQNMRKGSHAVRTQKAAEAIQNSPTSQPVLGVKFPEPQISPAPVATPAPAAAAPPPAPASAVKGVRYADVYALLHEKAQVIAGERMVRGAVPLMQVHHKMSPPQAVAALEHLLKHEYIARKGESWASIVLLKNKLEKEIDGVAMEQREQKAAKLAPVAHLRVVPPETERQDEIKKPTTSVSGASTIQQMEERVTTLRGLRDQVASHLASMEMALAAAKSAQAQFAESDASMKRLLEERREELKLLFAELF